MNVLSRSLPGGIFPRLVAFFTFFFPLSLINGVFLGLPLTLPELLLVALGFYFLFEHDSFRSREWSLWPVLLFALGLGLFIFESSLGFEGFQSILLFPLFYFVMARNVFREKPSMLLLAQRGFMASALLLGASVIQIFFSRGLAELPLGAPFGSEEALLVILGPAVLLSILHSVFSTSRKELVFNLLVLLTTLVALVLLQALLAFLLVGFCFGIYAIFYRPGKAPFRLLAMLALGAVLYAGLLLLQQDELLVFPHFTFVVTPFMILSLALLTVSVFLLLLKSLPWIQEKDSHRRFTLAVSLLCFVLLALFQMPHLTVTHSFLFWFFMASLL